MKPSVLKPDSAPLLCKLAWLLLAVVVIRFVVIVQDGELKFDSNLMALLSQPDDSALISEMQQRVSAEIDNRIVLVVKGVSREVTDVTTDELIEKMESGVEQGALVGTLIDGVDAGYLQPRINAMSQFKDKLIADRSSHRLLKNPDDQLEWRISRVTDFPPGNLTDPVLDPLGTVEEFVSERLSLIGKVSFDGLYLRVSDVEYANLVIFELLPGELAGVVANQSVNYLLGLKDELSDGDSVKVHVSGIPLHAAMVKQQTVAEIQWMAVLALVLTFIFFVYITRSIWALFVSVILIGLAVISGFVFSYETIGLPHLIGLTMATTAIGICIDFSFHFWVHVKAGLSAAESKAAIRPGLNMSLLTTACGLMGIAFTSIPVLARTAVFIIGALMASWLIVLYLFPLLVTKQQTTAKVVNSSIQLPERVARLLVCLGIAVSGIIVWSNYYIDDSPLRLGRINQPLVEEDRAVERLLGAEGERGLYLIRSDSAESLLAVEAKLLRALNETQKLAVSALSRLVPDEAQQTRSQQNFINAFDRIDGEILAKYRKLLQVEGLDWSTSSEWYDLSWVVEQQWANKEKSLLLKCDNQQCASMLKTKGEGVIVIDKLCLAEPACMKVSFSKRQIDAFATLRSNLFASLGIAVSLMMIVLFIRYKSDALRMMVVPLSAMLVGVAGVCIVGMPVTAFSLAALFPLLGLSLDYVIFTKEANHHNKPTQTAIFASALTTFISFGILALSSTPAVQFFALPVAFGIPFAWCAIHWKGLVPRGQEQLTN